MAICTAVSLYQKNKGLKLIDVNKNGDAFYLLQGRNENEGVFWPQSSVLEFGGSAPVLLTEQAQNILADFNDNVALGDVFARHTRLGGKYKGYKTR
jgi:hypothetical protein